MRNAVAAVAVAVLIVVALPSRADAIPFVPSPCDLAPSGPLQDACELVNLPSAAVDYATDTAAGVAVGGVDAATGGMASGIFDAALSWMSSLLSDTVKSAMDGLGAAMTQAPAPPVDTAWFHQQYVQVMVAGIGISVIMCILHLFSNLVRFKTWEMGRTFVLFLYAIFASATAPLFIRMGLQFADALTSAFASIGGEQAGQLTDKISEVTSSVTLTGSIEGAPALFTPLITILFLMIAVVLVIFWMILLTIRSIIIYLGTLAIPFVLPSIIDGKARFARLYFKAMFGVIMSAPILFGTLCFGSILIRDGMGAEGGWQSFVGGICLVGLASFLPLMFLKLLFPAAAPVVAIVEHGGKLVVSGVKSAGSHAADALSGGAASAALMAAHPDESTPRTPPPRPRGGTT